MKSQKEGVSVFMIRRVELMIEVLCAVHAGFSDLAINMGECDFWRYGILICGED